MSFELNMPGRIIFGTGSFERLSEQIARYGKRIFVICSASAVRAGFIDRLKKQDPALCYTVWDRVAGEPTPQSVDAAAAEVRASGCDAVLGLGGGSVLDTAKAAAALAVNDGSVEDYLEGVGRGAVITRKPLPFIAVPTTSGTGAENTKNAVISSAEKKYKKSFRHEMLLASVALIDPALTVSVPPAVTAACGMDAVTQLIESYTSVKSNPVTEAWCAQGLKRAGSLLKAYRDGGDIGAREDMSLCSTLSGLALANSGLGAAHGFAAGLGAYRNISHGLACAVLLPHIMRLNIPAATEKYAQVGRLLTGKPYPDDREAAKASVEFIERLNAEMGIPSGLGFLNISPEEAAGIAQASMGGSMNGNPVKLDAEAAEEYLLQLI
ncbi:MAG: iron-containing alcohol dehydrogenase [Firmicutes bacterium]|nr:iron-containing alcohol dehydrogenase [Bacillota bacterium]